MTRSVSLVAIAVLTSLVAACSGSNPAAPSYTPPPAPPAPTTAVLTVRLDAACFLASPRIASASVYLDGQYVGAVTSGSAYTTSVLIGMHNIEAAAYYASGVQGEHWGPRTEYVPAAGFTELFYCS